ELSPPPGKVITLNPGRPRRNEWKPTDPLYVTYLRSVQRVQPQAALQFICPASALIQVEKKQESPEETFRKDFAAFERSAELREAMVLYFKGNLNEAMTLLQKIRDMPEKASIHAQADDMRKDISTVLGDYNDGESALQVDDPEKAAPQFREALDLDEKLMRGKDFAEKMPSWA